MPFKWPFGRKAKRKKAEDDPLGYHLMLLGEVLEQLPVKSPDMEQNLRKIWKNPDNRYDKRGRPEYLSYHYQDVTGPELLANLKKELEAIYLCLADPEAREWVRAFQSMVTGRGDSYHHRWGAHEMVVEIHHFGPDRFTIVRKQYCDYYA
jgi:hypothetical protein